MEIAAANVKLRKHSRAQPGSTAYRNGNATMSPSKMPMSRPLNVPTGGRSRRTRRKKARAPTATVSAPTRQTPNSSRLCCSSGIGREWAGGMSCSQECVRVGERRFVQVAPGAPERPGLIVADDGHVHVQAGRGQVVTGCGVAEAVDRGGGQRELWPSILNGDAVAGRPGL